jgi:phosphohistidine phosphatase
MARTLILLRHAKSDWSGTEPDHRRPLTKRGRRQAAEAGAWLATHAQVDLAVVSTAERARATWALASAELPTTPELRLEERAYAASGHTLLGLVEELPDDVTTVVVVGHNPGLEDLAFGLAQQPLRMPTSALTVFALSGRWSEAASLPVQLVASGRPPAGL